MKDRYTIENEADHGKAIRALAGIDLKKKWVWTLKLFKEDRSIELNALSHAWYNQVSRQTHEDTPARIKGFCKLYFGVPILRAEEPDFCEAYDRIIKPNPDYEWKVDFMSQPDWFPVTSLMNVEQFLNYLNDVQAHYAMAGVQLNFPNEAPDYTDKDIR